MLGNLKRKIKWAGLILLCLAAMGVAVYGLDWLGFVQTWFGKLFKALSGATLGYALSRYVIDLDLSAISAEQRPLAGLSQAILIAGGMIAVASV